MVSDLSFAYRPSPMDYTLDCCRFLPSAHKRSYSPSAILNVGETADSLPSPSSVIVLPQAMRIVKTDSCPVSNLIVPDADTEGEDKVTIVDFPLLDLRSILSENVAVAVIYSAAA